MVKNKQNGTTDSHPPHWLRACLYKCVKYLQAAIIMFHCNQKKTVVKIYSVEHIVPTLKTASINREI